MKIVISQAVVVASSTAVEEIGKHLNAAVLSELRAIALAAKKKMFRRELAQRWFRVRFVANALEIEIDDGKLVRQYETLTTHARPVARNINAWASFVLSSIKTAMALEGSLKALRDPLKDLDADMKEIGKKPYGFYDKK